MRTKAIAHVTGNFVFIELCFFAESVLIILKIIFLNLTVGKAAESLRMRGKAWLVDEERAAAFAC